MTTFHAEVYREFVHIRVDGEDRSFDLREYHHVHVRQVLERGGGKVGRSPEKPEKAEGEGKIMLRSRS